MNGILAILVSLMPQQAIANGASSQIPWSVTHTQSDCILVYETESRDLMFSYQLKQNGEHVVGFRSDDLNAAAKRSDQSPSISFGNSRIMATGSIDPFVGFEIRRGKTLSADDFKLFQGHQYFVLSLDDAQVRIPTDGIDQVRAEFNRCLATIVTADTPPTLLNWTDADSAFSAVQAALLSKRDKELTILVDVDGKPISCRSIPDLSESEFLQEACQAYLEIEQYQPAEDVDGNAVAGEFVVFKSN